MKKIELTLKTDNSDGGTEVLVIAEFAGRKYECLLDTGAAITTLAWDEYTSSLPVLGEDESAGAFGKSRDDLVETSGFRLGPIELERLIVARLAKDQNARNLLGMDVLKDWMCSFRFSEAEVRVTQDRLEGGRQLYLGPRGHPYVDVNIGSSEVAAIWDTGAGLTCIDLAAIQSNPEYFEPAGNSVGTDSAGMSQSAPLFEVTGLSVGGVTFSPHIVVGFDLSLISSTAERRFDAILGMSTLAQTNWCFDFPGKRWNVSRIENVS